MPGLPDLCSERPGIVIVPKARGFSANLSGNRRANVNPGECANQCSLDLPGRSPTEKDLPNMYSFRWGISRFYKLLAARIVLAIYVDASQKADLTGTQGHRSLGLLTGFLCPVYFRVAANGTNMCRETAIW